MEDIDHSSTTMMQPLSNVTLLDPFEGAVVSETPGSDAYFDGQLRFSPDEAENCEKTNNDT